MTRIDHPDDQVSEPVITVAKLLGRPSAEQPDPRTPSHDTAAPSTEGHSPDPPDRHPPATTPAHTRRPRRWPWLAAPAVLLTVALSTGMLLTNAVPGTVSQLVLTTDRVAIGNSYFATASGFLPGERVRFSWTGPTNGVMDSFVADTHGAYRHGPIIERDPPGSYQIIATGLISGRVATTPLRVLPAPPRD